MRSHSHSSSLKPENILIYFPVVLLPILMGGTRPWLWGFVGGVFALLLAVFCLASRDFPPSGFRKPLLIVFPILIFCLLQAVPLPMSLVSALSPQRALWLGRAQELLGRTYSSASLSYVPLGTLFSGLWLLVLALFAMVLHRLLRNGTLRTGNLFLVLFTIVGLEALYGLLQALMPSLGTGDATGTFVNRNHYADFIGMVWPLQLAWLSNLYYREKGRDRSNGEYDERSGRQTTWEKQIFLTLIAGLTLLGLVFSKSRGGIVSVLIGTTVLVYFGGRRFRKMVPFVAGCWLVMIVYGCIIGFEGIAARFAQMEEGAQERFRLWIYAWNMVRDHWLTGTGPGTFGPVVFLYQIFDTDLYQIQNAHSDYLQILADWGLVFGLFMILSAWGYWWSTAIGLVKDQGSRHRSLRTEDRLVRAGALAGSAAFLSHIWVEFNWQVPANQLYFVILLVLMRYRTAR